MGLLQHIFGNSEEPSADWQLLTSNSDVDEVLLRSGDKLQVVFKHSTQCGISASALRSLREVEEEEVANAELLMVNVISDRPVSRYIAEKTGVRHQSPQILLIKEGEVVWSDSHYAVTKANLLDKLGEL